MPLGLAKFILCSGLRGYFARYAGFINENAKKISRDTLSVLQIQKQRKMYSIISGQVPWKPVQVTVSLVRHFLAYQREWTHGLRQTARKPHRIL